MKNITQEDKKMEKSIEKLKRILCETLYSFFLHEYEDMFEDEEEKNKRPLL